MAKFCTNCGAALDDDRKFCTNCGAAVSQAAQSAPGPAPEPAPEPASQPAARPAAPAQPAYTPPRQTYQPAYQSPAAPAGDTPPPPGSKYEPLSTGGFMGAMLLMCIPVVGWLLALVWAFGGCKQINKRNLARATLVFLIIGLVISLILGAAVKSLATRVAETIRQEAGIASDSGEVLPAASEDAGGLNGLLGLLGGLAQQNGDSEYSDSEYSGTNEGLETLDQLGQLMEGLEGLTGEQEGQGGSLSDLINAAEDINREAEEQGSGWPKSLRKYPGGTAKATASYRTEISGTTAEEMHAWIADLKKDGFAYQDFYGFGMSEEDMLSVDGWWATDGEIYLSLSYSDGTVTVDHPTELPDMSGLFGD